MYESLLVTVSVAALVVWSGGCSSNDGCSSKDKAVRVEVFDASAPLPIYDSAPALPTDPRPELAPPVLPPEWAGTEWWCTSLDLRINPCFRQRSHCEEAQTIVGEPNITGACTHHQKAACVVYPRYRPDQQQGVLCFAGMAECNEEFARAVEDRLDGDPYPSRCGWIGETK